MVLNHEYDAFRFPIADGFDREVGASGPGAAGESAQEAVGAEDREIVGSRTAGSEVVGGFVAGADRVGPGSSLSIPGAHLKDCSGLA